MHLQKMSVISLHENQEIQTHFYKYFTVLDQTAPKVITSLYFILFLFKTHVPLLTSTKTFKTKVKASKDKNIKYRKIKDVFFGWKK